MITGKNEEVWTFKPPLSLKVNFFYTSIIFCLNLFTIFFFSFYFKTISCMALKCVIKTRSFSLSASHTRYVLCFVWLVAPTLLLWNFRFYHHISSNTTYFRHSLMSLWWTKTAYLMHSQMARTPIIMMIYPPHLANGTHVQINQTTDRFSMYVSVTEKKI